MERAKEYVCSEASHAAETAEQETANYGKFQKPQYGWSELYYAMVLRGTHYRVL
jgi:hypothetical protein